MVAFAPSYLTDKARICTIASHELGHSIYDLDHSPNPAELMYQSVTYWEPCVNQYGRESALFLARLEIHQDCRTLKANIGKMFFRLRCGKRRVNVQWERSPDNQLVADTQVSGRSY